MSAALKASFILRLEDQLSTGIAALSRRLEALAKLSRSIGLSGLERADAILGKLGTAADAAGRRLDGVGRSARAAAAEVHRLATEAIRVNSVGVAMLPPGMARAAMAATILAASSSPGGRLPPMVPTTMPRLAAPAPLMLAGPGGGGIPLNLTPFGQGYAGGAAAYGRVQAGATAAAGAVRGLGAQVQGVSGQLGGLAHGAMGLFATGFGLAHPIKEFAKYEDVLRHIAITANTPLQDMGTTIAGLAKQYDALALATKQSAEHLAESANFLITTGIGRKAVDEMLPIVAQAATAYRVPVGETVQAVFALSHIMKVPDADMRGAISAAALAGKEGHFSFADFSRYLPSIAPLAHDAKLRGATGAREVMASLEVSRAGAGTSEEAFTNYRDYLSHLFGPEKHGLAHAFQQHGVDLHGVMLGAERRGESVPEAVIAQVKKLTEGKTAIEASLIVGNLFRNMQSANYVRARLQGDHQFTETQRHLAGADSSTIDNDFARAQGPATQLRDIEERLKQIERRFGAAFGVVLTPIEAALTKIEAGLKWMDQNLDGGSKKVLGYFGMFIAGAAVLGLMIPLFRLIGMGVMLVLTPLKWLVSGIALLARGLAFVGMAAVGMGLPFLAVIALVALLAGAAYLIYQNWEPVKAWWMQLWGSVKAIFGGFYEFLAGVFTGNMGRAAAGLMQMWEGLKGLFSTLWEGIKGVFTAFTAWVDGWSGGAMTACIEAIKGAWEGVKAFFAGLWAEVQAPFDAFISGVEQRINKLRNSDFGRALGVGDAPAAGAPGGAAAAPNASAGSIFGAVGGGLGGAGAIGRIQGEIVVRPAPGAVVESARTTGGDVRLTPAAPLGNMTGRN